MKDELITFKTAKLAKEKGFDLKSDFYNWYGSDKILNQKYDLSNTILAPTQSLLQKWLRDEYKLHITINIGLPHKSPIMYYSNVIKFGVHHKSKFRSDFYFTYEEALEKALQEALKLIKK